MKRRSIQFRGLAIAAVLALGLVNAARFAAAQTDEQVETQPPEPPPWHASLNLGAITFERDEAVKDGFAGGLRLGYDLSPRWTVEGVLFYAPSLGSNTVYNYEEGGVALPRPVARQGLSGESAAAIGLAVDFLFHLFVMEDRHWDPYLIAGAGLTHFTESRPHRLGTDPVLRYGAGMAYHFNDEWAVRLDLTGILTVEHTEFNFMPAAGLLWRWGTRTPSNWAVTGGPLDSDGDGLPDHVERQIGTDPFNPDTDGDGLTDYEEVRVYSTDPLNPDTDYDGLTDGREVYVYKTNPLVRDTDNGGVADGHEVIEDATNPLDPSDDLLLFTLHIEFETDKATILPEYYAELDKIGKTITRNPGSTVRVEGHADKRKTSVADYNLKLSERRAQAVAAHLSSTFKIASTRFTSIGYGFNRPMAPNDPVTGNRLNRRVEVYIRRVPQRQQAADPAQ